MHDFRSDVESHFPGMAPAGVQQLTQYLNLLYERNQVMNLTRVPEERAVLRHLVDSAELIEEIDRFQVASLIDIGTGAGLPGVVLAILRPNIQVVMVESIRKKANFVNDVLQALNISNALVLNSRAEALVNNSRFKGAFSAVTARAVAAISELITWSLPFISPEGQMFFQKGPKLDQELTEAKSLFKKHHLVYQTRPYSLSSEEFFVVTITRG